jgi:hypothetical protein
MKIICNLTVKISIFFLIAFQSNAQIIKLNENQLQINLKTTYTAGASIFDSSGTLTSIFHDTINSEEKRWNFETGMLNFNLGIQYGITNHWSIGLDLPISYKWHKETYEPNNNNYREVRFNNELLLLDAIILGTKYYLIDTTLKLFFNGSMRIPGNFKSNKIDLENYPLYGYGPYSFYSGIGAFYDFNEYYLKAEIGHSLRSSPFSKQMHYAAEFGLTSIKDIVVAGQAEYVKSYDGQNQLMNIRQYQYFNEYLLVGFLFSLVLDNKFITDFSYKVHLLGKNSVLLGDFNITLGIIL